jgi:hypothetical protein
MRGTIHNVLQQHNTKRIISDHEMLQVGPPLLFWELAIEGDHEREKAQTRGLVAALSRIIAQVFNYNIP